MSPTAANWSNKVLAITGGTGSFGQKMLEHVLQTDIQEIRIISRDEYKHDAMAHKYPDSRIKFLLRDVRERDGLSNLLEGADFLFHAAALKQVPSCELQPMEAVKTNILGSSNVLQSAIEAQVSSVVVLSTDKAVYPLNAMGISKAMMERLALAAAESAKSTAVNVTRYGNVLFSRGSVIPLFIRQARSGLPLSITEESMTRFLLPLSEATQLVEHALFSALSGNIFVRKSKSASVGTIARAIIENLATDSKVRRIGIRPGEKIHETLLTEEELSFATDEGEFYRTNLRNRKPTAVTGALTSDSVYQMNEAEVWDLLQSQPELTDLL